MMNLARDAAAVINGFNTAGRQNRVGAWQYFLQKQSLPSQQIKDVLENKGIKASKWGRRTKFLATGQLNQYVYVNQFKLKREREAKIRKQMNEF